jgi:tRNA (cytidine/uridine-2'-O-)-methyltransferase
MIASPPEFAMSDALYLVPGEPRLHLVLVNPQIPPNTGNVARLCAVTGTPLHLVAPLGFSLSEKKLRRAGLDYWDKVHAATHASFDEMVRENAIDSTRLHLFTARGTGPSGRRPSRLETGSSSGKSRRGSRRRSWAGIRNGGCVYP